MNEIDTWYIRLLFKLLSLETITLFKDRLDYQITRRIRDMHFIARKYAEKEMQEFLKSDDHIMLLGKEIFYPDHPIPIQMFHENSDALHTHMRKTYNEGSTRCKSCKNEAHKGWYERQDESRNSSKIK